MRVIAQTAILGYKVPFVGTAKLKVLELTPDRVRVVVFNRHRVRNHIKGVHAAAMALLAETATGLAIAMHMPDDKVPLIKKLTIDFRARATGSLAAVAQLSVDQIAAVIREAKGEISVANVVTDESGKEPILCEAIWAWIPKSRPST